MTGWKDRKMEVKPPLESQQLHKCLWHKKHQHTLSPQRPAPPQTALTRLQHVQMQQKEWIMAWILHMQQKNWLKRTTFCLFCFSLIAYVKCSIYRQTTYCCLNYVCDLLEQTFYLFMKFIKYIYLSNNSTFQSNNVLVCLNINKSLNQK